MEWIPSRGKFLFPAEVVKQLYRGKMIAYFREAVKEGTIAILPESDDAPESFRKVVDALYTENWVVYLKESIASPGSTIKYLASYINRIAISDRRIVAVNGDHVTFRYIDRSDGNTEKLLTIPLADLISRFLLHVVPSGFVRVRYYGFLSNRNRGENMARCRAAVSGESEAIDQEEASVAKEELNAAETVPSFPVCPHCRSRKQTLTKKIPKRSDLLYPQIA